ncbi:MAG: hypothetical protein M3Q32_02350 [Pseudomonadota bacterium]|nr:hypothetical protein [Pseudomonadota bacterium]
MMIAKCFRLAARLEPISRKSQGGDNLITRLPGKLTSTQSCCFNRFGKGQFRDGTRLIGNRAHRFEEPGFAGIINLRARAAIGPQVANPDRPQLCAGNERGLQQRCMKRRNPPTFGRHSLRKYSDDFTRFQQVDHLVVDAFHVRPRAPRYE